MSITLDLKHNKTKINKVLIQILIKTQYVYFLFIISLSKGLLLSQQNFADRKFDSKMALESISEDVKSNIFWEEEGGGGGACLRTSLCFEAHMGHPCVPCKTEGSEVNASEAWRVIFSSNEVVDAKKITTSTNCNC